MNKARSNPPETDIWYRLLFEANPLAMLIYDRQSFSFLDANRSALQQYGYSRSEWLKMSVRDLHPASDLATVSNELAAMPDASFHRAGIWRQLRKDGTEMFVDIVRYLIPYHGKNAALAIVHDVTAQHRTEEALRVVQSDLLISQKYRRHLDA